MVPDQPVTDTGNTLFPSPSMDAAQAVQVPGGEVVVFGRASPDKDAPNEDSAAVLRVHGHMSILAVADGLGGARDGKEASATAMRSLHNALTEAEKTRSSPRSAILNGLEQANRDILSRGVGSATTVVVAAIAGDFIRAYHVGDSSLLQVGQRGRIVQQTVAHSPVGFAEAAGMLTEEEALHHEERHFVSNTLGSSEMRIEVGPSLRLNRRDTVVLGSDGLFDNLRTEEIVQTIRRGPLLRAGQQLQLDARHRMTTAQPEQPSKPDDLTFILFRRTS